MFQANVDPRKNPSSRTEIQVLFQNLPKPIDLEIGKEENTLWWTDRGELPVGNSFNYSKLSVHHKLSHKRAAIQPRKDCGIFNRNLHEAIGLELDKEIRHVYASDLGGAVYRFDMDGRNRTKLYEEQGVYTGFSIAFD